MLQTAPPHRPVTIVLNSHLAKIANGAIALLLSWLYVTRGTGNILWEDPRASDGFFGAQLRSLLRGSLAVDPATLHGECWYVGERCYGYFGLTGSILRLPLLVIGSPDTSATPILLWLGTAIGICSSLVLLAAVTGMLPPPPEALVRLRDVSVALAGTGLSLGSLLLLDPRPTFFTEAVVWAAALTCLGAALILWWWRDGRSGWLIAALIVLTLAANARPTAAAAAAALGAWIVVSAILNSPQRRIAIALGGAISVIPLGTLLLTYVAKFSTPFPPPFAQEQVPEAPWWAAIRPSWAKSVERPYNSPSSRRSGIPSSISVMACAYSPRR